MGKVKAVILEEYKAWESWLEARVEIMDRWPGCEECDTECDYCLHNLIGLEENVGEFFTRVKKFVEGTVEELYLHPHWDADECAEYGEEIGYLVDLYFKYNLNK